MTDDLVAFLRACLGEDERVAQAVTVPSPWTVYEFLEPTVQAGDGRTVGVIGFDESAAHIASHDPARVLAEVAAKRRIIDLHVPWNGKQNDDGTYCSTCVGYPIDSHGHVGVEWPCPTLRLLALPYAGHPDYRAEWAPDEEENRG